MESSDTTTITSSSSRSVSPSSSSPPPSQTHYSHPPLVPPPSVVVSPCAACKILRRRCAEKCVLAPYFPPSDPIKFTTAHRVFGASNIIKFLQELPETQRADAVSSMVYEANARLRDPVYGSAGAICQLQKQVGELQAQLAKAQAELVTMQCQQANLMAIICMEMAQSPQLNIISSPQHHQQQQQMSMVDNNNFNINNNNNNNNPNNNNLNILDPFYDNFSAAGAVAGPLWEPLWT